MHRLSSGVARQRQRIFQTTYPWSSLYRGRFRGLAACPALWQLVDVCIYFKRWLSDRPSVTRQFIHSSYKVVYNIPAYLTRLNKIREPVCSLATAEDAYQEKNYFFRPGLEMQKISILTVSRTRPPPFCQGFEFKQWGPPMLLGGIPFIFVPYLGRCRSLRSACILVVRPHRDSPSLTLPAHQPRFMGAWKGVAWPLRAATVALPGCKRSCDATILSVFAFVQGCRLSHVAHIELESVKFHVCLFVYAWVASVLHRASDCGGSFLERRFVTPELSSFYPPA